MSKIINNYSNALRLSDESLVKEISEKFGVKAVVSRNDDRLFIGLSHYESCFFLMKKLRWDFDYSVHKKGEIYIIDIANCDVENFSEETHRVKVKKASQLFDNSNAHLL